MSSTIYHAHGIGAGAIDGLRAAGQRIAAAHKRLQAQPPAPIPPVEAPEPPALPVTDSGYGLHLHTDHNVVYLKSPESIGSVERKFLENLTPDELLALTERAEAVAAEYERLADEHEAAVERATADALRSADPAIRALAERMSAERQADAERVAWIEAHGSERLRRLLAEGIEHGAVYRDERLALERPGWLWEADTPGRYGEPRNAPTEALDMLDEARKTAPDAKLVYWTVEQEAEDDYGMTETQTVRGYTAQAKFLGRTIVWQVADDGTPPVVIA